MGEDWETIANIAAGVFTLAVNLCAFAALVVNIGREARAPSLSVLFGTIAFSKMASKGKDESTNAVGPPTGPKSRSQSGPSDGDQPKAKSLRERTSSNVSGGTTSPHSSKFTDAFTVLLNRVLLVCVIISTVAAYDVAGIRGVYNFRGWFVTCVIQLWLVCAAFCQYFLSWIQFLLYEAKANPLLIRRVRIWGLSTTHIVNTVTAGFLLIALAFKNQEVCVTAYITWLSFWISLPLIMLSTTVSAAWKTISILRKTGFNDKNYIEIVRIKTKAKYFTLCCAFTFGGFVVSFAAQVWNGMCHRDEILDWYYLLIQVMFPAAYPLGILFNWIKPEIKIVEVRKMSAAIPVSIQP